MTTIYCTDGDRDTVVVGVGMTVYDYTAPDGDHSMFGDLGRGYMRQVDVDLATLDGLFSGGGIIGYFSEAALARPHPDSGVPLLVELIAAGERHDVIVPPLLTHSPASIAGRAPPHTLSLDEQQALFARVLGNDWPRQVEGFLEAREAVAAAA